MPRVLIAAVLSVACLGMTLATNGVWAPSMAGQPFGWSSVDLFADGVGYVHRYNSDGEYFWKTQDGGVTYTPLTPPPGRLVTFASGTLGYSAFIDDLWRTDDGAATWQKIEPPTGDTGWPYNDITAIDTAQEHADPLALGFVNKEKPGRCGADIDTYSTHVALSADGATSWESALVAEFPAQIQQIEVLSEDFAVAIATQWKHRPDEDGCGGTLVGTIGDLVYVIERSDVDATGGDGPSLAARQVLDCRPRICGSVGIASPETFTVGFVDGGIAHTEDGGKSFTFGHLDSEIADAVSDVTGQDRMFWISEIEFATEQIGYAATNGRGIWRTADGGATWTVEPSAKEVYDIGIADLAVADTDHAVAGGPTLVVRRLPN